MEKEDAENYCKFLEELWRSNASIAAKCFWTSKMNGILAAGGWTLQIKTVNFAVEAA